MRWIFLIAPSFLDSKNIIERYAVEKRFSVYAPQDLGVYVLPIGTPKNFNFLNSYNRCYVQFESCSLDDLVRESEYDEAYLKLQREDNIAYQIKWDNDRFLRSALTIFSNEPDMFIDNEHDLILPVSDFLKWWKINPFAPVG